MSARALRADPLPTHREQQPGQEQPQPCIGGGNPGRERVGVGIEGVVPSSAATGEPYRIRFANGQEAPSAEYLRVALAKLRARAP